MKKQKHDLNIRIALDDYVGECASERSVKHVFDIIEKVKSAVFSKGGEVRSFTFDATPTRDFNPLGNIGTLTFDIRTPYECEANLHLSTYRRDRSPLPPEWILAVDFKILES